MTPYARDDSLKEPLYLQFFKERSMISVSENDEGLNYERFDFNSHRW